MADSRKALKGVVSAVVILAALGFLVWRFTRPKPSLPTGDAVGAVTGTRLAEALIPSLGPGARVIIFGLDTEQTSSESARKALAARGVPNVQVVTLKASDIGPSSLGGEGSALVDMYNRSLPDMQGVSGVIFCSPFPNRPAGLKVLSASPGLKIAAAGFLTPEAAALVKQGKVQAMLAVRTGVGVIEDMSRMTPEKMFEQKYVLVTSENVDSVPAHQPMTPAR